MNIIVIEDDARVADFLDRGLRAEGYSVCLARNGPDGLAMVRDAAFKGAQGGPSTVVLLDVMLPGMNGLEVCQNLRADGVSIPILMLTALGSLEDRVSGLRLGADDYLAKPFAFEELLARIQALMRRSGSISKPAAQQLKFADLILDRERWRVTRAGKLIALSAKELALLELFMTTPGRVFSRERILATVWGVNEDPLTNIVDVYIRRLRSKIDDGHAQALIHTVRGLGYRMDSESQE